MYYFAKMSRHGQNGLSFVPKKILTWVPREARVGLKATAGKRATALLSLYPHSVLLLSVSFSQNLVFETISAHSGIVGLSQSEL